MKTIPYRQGSPEWLAERSTPNTYTASEAPAMMGLSKYVTRSELIRKKATGITPEVDAFTQGIFDAGHAAEASMREWAETEVGDDLYPVTGTVEVEGMLLLASFDGLTMDESIVWEQKSWNDEFARQVLAGEVPDTHWPQLEQQLLVSGAEKALFTVSNGDDTAVAHIWYTSQPERRARLIAGWKQFAEDVRNYNPANEAPAEVVSGRAPDMLPALHIEVTGMVTASNLAQFKATALTVFRGINTNLQTDQDFADAEKAVKFCKDAEERLDAAKHHALSQTASIDELFRTIDQIKDEAKAVRLKLDKLVKGEKENRKAEIIVEARKKIEDHIQALNKRIGGNWMQASAAPFAESIKGLKSLDSMREKIGNALRDMMIDANKLADRIEANGKALTDAQGNNWNFLFHDFGQVCTKPTEDFAALVAMRAGQHREENEKRMEAERARIRAEEQAKAEREAQAKARAEQAERDSAAVALAKEQWEADYKAAEKARSEADAKAQPVVDTGATMKLGEVCAQLGFSVTADFMLSLGFSPVGTERAAKLYRASDFNLICAALIAHIASLSGLPLGKD